MLTWAVIAAVLLAWGAHGVVPWSLATASNEVKRLWRLAALPSALAATLLTIFSLARQPDLALAAGLGPSLPTTWPARVSVALILLGILGDTALLLREPRTGFDWWAVSALGLAGTAGLAALGELTRIGAEPTFWTTFFIGVACRLVVALAAGEAFVARRPRWGIPAALALFAYPIVLPPNSGAYLARSGDLLTMAAAALIFGAARWLPERLRRPAIVGAALLAALVLARAQLLSAALTAQTPFALSIE